MHILAVLVLIFSVVCTSLASFDDLRYYQQLSRPYPEAEYVKRLMPKERRAPSADFDDMTSLMRSLDNIQKPRFG